MKTLHLKPNSLFLIIFDLAFDLNGILTINVKTGSTSEKKAARGFCVARRKRISKYN